MIRGKYNEDKTLWKDNMIKGQHNKRTILKRHDMIRGQNNKKDNSEGTYDDEGITW